MQTVGELHIIRGRDASAVWEGRFGEEFHWHRTDNLPPRCRERNVDFGHGQRRIVHRRCVDECIAWIG